ncbi:hypothetical protein BJ742DRAFT_134543 [Cladochytrium replicatum]|nr:hypothetical protein BJ742DRAFT_134543 [Cladochytrium replicatum]
MPLPSPDLIAGRVVYAFNAIIAASCFIVSVTSLLSSISTRSTRMFRNALLVGVSLLMTVESTDVDIEFFLTWDGRLSLFAAYFRLLVLSCSLNIIVFAQVFRLSVVASPLHRLLYQSISGVVLLSTSVFLTIFRFLNLSEQYKKEANFNPTTFKDPLLTSVITSLVPTLVAFYGSYVVFLPALYKATRYTKPPALPPKSDEDSQLESKLQSKDRDPYQHQSSEVSEVIRNATQSLLWVEIAFNGAAILIFSSFLVILFLPLGPIAFKSFSTFFISLIAFFECYFVHLVRLFTGARSLYDRLTASSTSLQLSRRKHNTFNSNNHNPFRTLRRDQVGIASSDSAHEVVAESSMPDSPTMKSITKSTASPSASTLQARPTSAFILPEVSIFNSVKDSLLLPRGGDSHNDKALSIISQYRAPSPDTPNPPERPPPPPPKPVTMQQFSTATKLTEATPRGTQFRMHAPKLSEDIGEGTPYVGANAAFRHSNASLTISEFEVPDSQSSLLSDHRRESVSSAGVRQSLVPATRQSMRPGSVQERRMSEEIWRDEGGMWGRAGYSNGIVSPTQSTFVHENPRNSMMVREARSPRNSVVGMEGGRLSAPRPRSQDSVRQSFSGWESSRASSSVGVSPSTDGWESSRVNSTVRASVGAGSHLVSMMSVANTNTSMYSYSDVLVLDDTAASNNVRASSG